MDLDRTSLETVILSGCAPVPLAHYLKALAVLRLVTNGAGRGSVAKGYWFADQFQLESEFNQDDLIEFFLTSYQPTPVVAPWNGGSGFYKKDNRESIEAIANSAADRLRSYQSAIEAARGIVAAFSLAEKPEPQAKELLLQSCRNRFPEAALSWLDAVLVLGKDGPKYPPLLGTGGNDGRLEFTNNFMQRILEVMDPMTGEPAADSERWLRAALFGAAAMNATAKAPIGQFFPGAAGGANGTSGFDAPSTVNPWDFILMIEGALLFATASVKRLESSGDGSLVYPFCVRQSGVGYGSAAAADEKDARCEMWLPIWERPTTLAELQAIFGEGRAQVDGRPARNGVDFARAAVTLGLDRGIVALQRYGFQVRNGLAYFATPLDRLVVRRNAGADLLSDIDHWLDRLRQKAGPKANPEAPASVARALNQLERNIIDLCRDDSTNRLQTVLIALGGAERALARSFKWTTGESTRLRPLQGLSPEWLERANTNSVEFRLAASLAGTRASLGKETLWLRQHLEPLAMGTNAERTWMDWDDLPGNDVVWHDGSLIDALNAVMARRMIRAEKAGTHGWPDWSPRTASLDDIAAFIEGQTDDTLFVDLLWGLSLIDWDKLVRMERIAGSGRRVSSDSTPCPSVASAVHKGVVPSSFYALLRLAFRGKYGEHGGIPLVPAIHRRARQGDGEAASQLAVRRLRGSGHGPLVPQLAVGGEAAKRTAAAMMFPISLNDFRTLERAILHQS